MKFRTSLFNGYKREAVDEYVEDLLQKIEDLETEIQEGRAAKASNSQLQEENERLKEQLRLQTEKLDTERAADKEKLKKYESEYSGFMSLMVSMKEEAKKIVTDAQSDAEEVLRMAKKDADKITSAAREDAEKIREQAKTEADSCRQKVEEELFRKQEEEAEKFETARHKISEYLDSLNRSQNKVIDVYEEFGRIVEQLPLRLGDVFSSEPFELLEDPRRKKSEEEVGTFDGKAEEE